MISSKAWAKVIPELTALLWNEDQQQLKFEPLEQTMEMGMQVLEGARRPNGYILLYVGPTKEVQRTMEQLQPAMEARRAIKAARRRSD